MVANNYHDAETINNFTNEFTDLKCNITALDNLLDASDNQNALLELIAESNFEKGILTFDLNTVSVELSISVNKTTKQISAERFKNSRSEAILRRSEFLKDVVLKGNTAEKQEMSEKLKHFLNMCSDVDKVIRSITELKDLSYPLQPQDDSVEMLVEVSELSSKADDLDNLLKLWSRLIDDAQGTAFRGLHPKEICDLLLTAPTDRDAKFQHLLGLFPIQREILDGVHVGSDIDDSLTPDTLSPEWICDRLQAIVDSCGPVASTSSSIFNYYQSASWPDMFQDTLKVGIKEGISLSFKNVLLCTNSTVLSSLKAIIFDSVESPKIISGIDMLSLTVFEELLGFLQYLTGKVKFQIHIIGVTKLIPDNSTANHVSVPKNVDDSVIFALSKVEGIYTSDCPGQGKTTKAKQHCEKSLYVSGKLNFSEIISTQLVNVDFSNPSLHIDIGEPFDVLSDVSLEQTWCHRTDPSNRSPLNSFDFYNLCVLLFSFSYLHGIRHNGTSFALYPNSKLFIEFATYHKHPHGISFDWYYYFKTQKLTFSIPELILTGDDVTTCLNYLSEIRPVDSTNQSHLTLLLSETFCKSLAPPRPQYYSYRLLSNIITLVAQQLTYFPAFSASFIETSEESTNQISRTEIIELLFGFSRKVILLSTPTTTSPTPKDHDVIISWSSMTDTMFCLQNISGNSLLINVPSRSSNLPPSFSQALQVYDPYKRGAIPDSIADRRQMIRGFTFSGDLPAEFLNQNYRYFALTRDCFLKQVLLTIRLKVNLPSILVGSSGIGKTFLIRFLCSLLFYNSSIDSSELFRIISVNPGTSLNDIEEVINEINIAAERLPSRLDQTTVDKLFPVLFFDECNTSEHLGVISSLITTRRYGHMTIHPSVRILGAMNPVTADKLYTVYPVPANLIPFTLNFGTLDPADEKEYVEQIAKSFGFDRDKSMTLSKSLVACHSKIPTKNVSWMVSLRDAVRCCRILKSLLEFRQRINEDHCFFAHITPRDVFKELLIIAIHVCYVWRVPGDQHQKQIVLAVAKELKSSSGQMKQLVDCTAENLAIFLNKPEDVRDTEYFLQNILALFVGILTCTPIILIGNPGLSKSLSLTLLVNFLARVDPDTDSGAGLFQAFVTYFQGSASATTQSVMDIINYVKNLVPRDFSDASPVRYVLAFDEMSLLKDAPSRPLKLLHTVLEPRDGVPNFSFVGISNSHFDAAPTSRSIVIQRQIPVSAQFKKAVKNIGGLDKASADQMDVIRKDMEGLVSKVFGMSSKCNFYGMRDAYQFAKWMGAWQTSNVLPRQRAYQFMRSYGGLSLSNPEVAAKYRQILKTTCGVVFPPLSSDESSYFSILPHKIARRALWDSLLDYSNNSRHVLLIGTLEAALNCLKADRADDIEVFVGSQFESDAYKEYGYNQLSRVISACFTGKVVVLSETNYIIGALFDLINKNYIRKDDKTGFGMARVSIGTVSNSTCSVSERTKIVLVVNDVQKDILKIPTALLNRLEKFVLKDMYPKVDETRISQISDLFDKLGVCHSLPNQTIDQRHQFIDELSQLDNASTGFESFLRRLAHPLHCYCSSVTPSIVGHGGYLNLYTVLESIQQPNAPSKVIVISSVKGQSITHIPGYLDLVTSKVAITDSLHSLEHNLLNSAEQLLRNLFSSSTPDSKVLLIIELVEEDSIHFNSICDKVNSLHRVLTRRLASNSDFPNSAELVNALDVAIVNINPKDIYISPHSSLPIFYCDCINSSSKLPLLVSSYEDLYTFSLNDLDDIRLSSLLRSLVLPCLLSCGLQISFLKELYIVDTVELLNSPEILEDVDIFFNVFKDITRNSGNEWSLLGNHMEISFRKGCSVVHSIESFARTSMTPIVTKLLKILIHFNFFGIIRYHYEHDADFSMLRVSNFLMGLLVLPLFSTIDKVILKQLKFSLSQEQELHPYLLFTGAFLQHYTILVSEIDKNEPNYQEIIDHYKGHIITGLDSLPAEIIEQLEQLTSEQLTQFLFEYFELGSHLYFQSTLGDAIDSFQIFENMFVYIVQPQKYHHLKTYEFLSEKMDLSSSDLVFDRLARKLLMILSPECTTAVRGLLDHLPEDFDHLDLFLITWLRLALYHDCHATLRMTIEVNSIQDILNFLKILIGAPNQPRLHLFGALIELMDVDLLMTVKWMESITEADTVPKVMSLIFFKYFEHLNSSPLHLLRNQSSLSQIEAFFTHENDLQKLCWLGSTLAHSFTQFYSDFDFSIVSLSELQTYLTRSSTLSGICICSRLFGDLLITHLTSSTPIPFNILKFMLEQPLEDSHLIGAQTSIVNYLLSTKSQGEALQELQVIINNSNDGSDQAKRQLLSSLSFKPSDFSGLASDTDWSLQEEVRVAFTQLQSKSLDLNILDGVKLKTVLISKEVNPFTDFKFGVYDLLMLKRLFCFQLLKCSVFHVPGNYLIFQQIFKMSSFLSLIPILHWLNITSTQLKLGIMFLVCIIATIVSCLCLLMVVVSIEDMVALIMMSEIGDQACDAQIVVVLLIQKFQSLHLSILFWSPIFKIDGLLCSNHFCPHRTSLFDNNFETLIQNSVYTSSGKAYLRDLFVDLCTQISRLRGITRAEVYSIIAHIIRQLSTTELAGHSLACHRPGELQNIQSILERCVSTCVYEPLPKLDASMFVSLNSRNVPRSLEYYESIPKQAMISLVTTTFRLNNLPELKSPLVDDDELQINKGYIAASEHLFDFLKFVGQVRDLTSEHAESKTAECPISDLFSGNPRLQSGCNRAIENYHEMIDTIKTVAQIDSIKIGCTEIQPPDDLTVDACIDYFRIVETSQTLSVYLLIKEFVDRHNRLSRGYGSDKKIDLMSSSVQSFVTVTRTSRGVVLNPFTSQIELVDDAFDGAILYGLVRPQFDSLLPPKSKFAAIQNVLGLMNEFGYEFPDMPEGPIDIDIIERISTLDNDDLIQLYQDSLFLISYVLIKVPENKNQTIEAFCKFKSLEFNSPFLLDILKYYPVSILLLFINTVEDLLPLPALKDLILPQYLENFSNNSLKDQIRKEQPDRVVYLYREFKRLCLRSATNNSRPSGTAVNKVIMDGEGFAQFGEITLGEAFEFLEYVYDLFVVDLGLV
ncbi:hypothetical protein GEMRC1_003616 [Eukaryota sp. GEM-RC1]